MGKLKGAAAAGGDGAARGTGRLAAAGWRDWVEAVWAEAHEVPPGFPRLAWRAGAVWLVVREAMTYRAGLAVLFVAAATVAAWAAWPELVGRSCRRGSVRGDRHGAAAGRAAAAHPPVLRAGQQQPRAARCLRVGGYAAILALMPAVNIVAPFPFTVPQRGPDLRVFYASGNPSSDLPGTSSGGPPWQGEIPLVLFTACYVVVILWVTSRRSR